ncbi:leukemia inhibitory factor receptor-like [Hemicordylus capensis]|uniref:leukemia inhibitory factor receptor-like n=1 Tax=Hemicordylus capensis TaxID=884348 RepID=UPI00230394AB|nr:leukemia inhibitory factor receptor-like [Hemicordylus capensis]XP_053152320.1 leukemia inhibitory factor receptor-like [Hemicordylus capensis]
MWINQILYCLLAVAGLCFLNSVHSQEADSSYTPQNLTCITHDLNTVHCTWTTASATSPEFTYKFCPTTSASDCSETKDKRTSFQLISFDHPGNVEIITLHSGKAIAKKTFVLHENNISLVPLTPRIERLSANFSTQTLILEWKDGGAAFPYELDALWEIQILRKDPMEEVARETYHSVLTKSDTILRWNWTSDLPLECTTHYVRIRCLVEEEHFAGSREWSEWSQLENVPGQDKGSVSKVYPVDPLVPVGSNLTFCCLWHKKQRFISLGYDRCSPEQCPTVSLSNQSMLIYVRNVTVNDSLKNVFCNLTPEADMQFLVGSVLFVGYPPDVPQNLGCETRDFKEITCKWKPGRPTNLLGRRATIYTVFERISGRKNTAREVYSYKFPIPEHQKTYNITVYASNSLGHTEASNSANINQRVYPQTPSRLYVNNNSPTSISLYWDLPGNFKQIPLHCQINRSSSTTHLLQDVFLDGEGNSRYRTSIDKLQPYTTYTLTVRCATAHPLFWKWSGWSKEMRHRTLEAPPARGLDVWRERSTDGDTVKIFWKPLPASKTNGVIQSYKVSWFPPEMPENFEEVNQSRNSTEIKLGGTDYVFMIVAKNQAGSSPPSWINSAEIPNDDATTENGIATGNGIYLTWNPDSNVTCGYTVRWCHSFGSEPCAVNWENFPSNVTSAVIKSAHFQAGVRYYFSVYGCKTNGFQLLKHVNGYTKELEPRAKPVFDMVETTSDSILIKWKDIPIESMHGFLKGYLLRFAKEGEDANKLKSFDLGRPYFNITEPNKKTLKITHLQGKTNYCLKLSAYTAGGIGPEEEKCALTKENPEQLILAIIIPVAIFVVFVVLTSILCYRKREWIKETFYPDIPNPENSKALEFPKDPEGNPNSKTLEMNPCTPNNIEVIETQSPCLKIEDTAMTSPVAEDLPEDGLDSETESHVVVSYCPAIIEEEISNPTADESAGSSQVIYIDIQSLKEEPEVSGVAAAGYKPQMQLPVNSMRNMEEATSAEEDLDNAEGYRPQANTTTWNTDCLDSPTSIESNIANVSFGSPCSINSRQFLIPSKEDDDSPKAINTGWSFSNFFHSKPSD